MKQSFTSNKSSIMKKSKYQQFFHCLHTTFICILVQFLVEYKNYSNKRHIQRCGAYQWGGAFQREALISMWIPKGEAHFLGSVLIRGNTFLFVLKQSYICYYIICMTVPSSCVTLEEKCFRFTCLQLLYHAAAVSDKHILFQFSTGYSLGKV